MMNFVTFFYPLVPVIIELILLYRKMPCVILLDVTQTLKCFSSWNIIIMREEVKHYSIHECSTPTECVDTTHIIAAVG
jgi:hypothetical protein